MRDAIWRAPIGAVMGLGLLAGAPAAAQPPGAGHGGPGHGAAVLDARIWLDRGRDPVVRRGDRVRLYYRTGSDAYVAVFHVDTDGNVGLVHPRYPGEDHYVRARRDYRLLFPRAPYWHVDESPGLGYFFLVASRRPFDFSRLHYAGGHGRWDLSRVGRTVYGDPYAAMDLYVEALIPGWERVSYGLGFVEYHVGRAYRYPRFLCYDCHGFRPYDAWNPYRYHCRSFRVVIHTDPVYYPVRRYGPRRVVLHRPRFSDRPRFTFKERVVGAPGTPVVRRRAKPRGSATPGGAVGREPRPRTPGADVRRPSASRPRIRAGEAPERRDARRRNGEADVRRRPTSVLPGRGRRPALREGSGEIRRGEAIRDDDRSKARMRRPQARERSRSAARARRAVERPDRVRGGEGNSAARRPVLRPRGRSGPDRRPAAGPRGGERRPAPTVRPGQGRTRPSARPSGSGAPSRPSARPSRGGSRPPPGARSSGAGSSRRSQAVRPSPGGRVRPPAVRPDRRGGLRPSVRSPDPGGGKGRPGGSTPRRRKPPGG